MHRQKVRAVLCISLDRSARARNLLLLPDIVPACQARDARRKEETSEEKSEKAIDGLSALAYSPAKRRKAAAGAVAAAAVGVPAPPSSRNALPTQSPAHPPWDVLRAIGAKCANESGATHTVAARGLLQGAKASLPGLEVRALVCVCVCVCFRPHCCVCACLCCVQNQGLFLSCSFRTSIFPFAPSLPITSRARARALSLYLALALALSVSQHTHAHTLTHTH